MRRLNEWLKYQIQIIWRFVDRVLLVYRSELDIIYIIRILAIIGLEKLGLVHFNVVLFIFVLGEIQTYGAFGLVQLQVYSYRSASDKGLVFLIIFFITFRFVFLWYLILDNLSPV